MPPATNPSAGGITQFPVQNVPGQSTPTRLAPPSLAAGQQLVAQVRQAIAAQDYHTAVQTYRSATAMQSALPQPAGNQIATELQSLRFQLEQIGIDSALLMMPTSVSPLPPIGDAIPMDIDLSLTPKQRALRLVAIGRAALDRGDIGAALGAARQAESLRVPESEFAAGEPRVWQLMLDAESASRRSGYTQPGTIAQTAGQMPFGGPSPTNVQPALGTNAGNAIAQMNYNGEISGATGGNLSSPAIAQVQFNQPSPESRGEFAAEMFSAGMEALTAGDKPLAMKNFREAWKYEADLDPAMRSQLQDKLTLLQPTRLAPMKSTADAGKPLSSIEKAELESQEKTRRLYREVTSELAKAEQSKESAPLDTLDQLESLRRRVDGADLDDTAKRSLAVMVGRAIADQKKYVEANRAKIDLDLQNESVRMQIEQDGVRAARIDQEVSSLVDEFNNLYNEKRFEEAEIVAKQVAELKPEDTVSVMLTHKARMGIRLMMAKEVNDAKELAFVDSLLDVERASIGINPDLPMTLPEAQQWKTMSATRLRKGDGDPRLSAAENEIKSKLSTPVNVKYPNRPLGEVLDDLSALTGIPIVVDERALSVVRVTTETPINLQLQNSISLKSALNIMLERLELTYVIENDVLTITSIESKRSKVYPKLYRVVDLVTPIPNFTSSYEDGLAGALRAAYQMSNNRSDVQVVPVSMTDLGNGLAQKMSPMSGGNSNVLGQYAAMGSQGGFGLNNPPGGGGGSGGQSFANFDSLIELIQTTVVPDTWDLLGGPSTMRQYEQNLSLVISTTSEVHDQISELLESLRKLQNLQITIEVRFITLSDTFAERIGVDFDVQFDDNTQRLPDDDAGPSVTVGFDGAGITSDLDVRLNNALDSGAPAFGGASVSNPSTLGFAILSDIEAFFFLQAIQSDSRTNVMQAPKVTLFDGQIASISDVTQRPFVTSITPVVGDFAVAQQPVIVVLNEGTQLNVQGLVSDDKRFVRLTLVPFFSQIGDVDTFTFQGRQTSNASSRTENDTNGDGVVDEDDDNNIDEENEIVEGTTVQLPTFAFTSVSTTVSVPDGGTILLGGIKRMSESRSEVGVPILSKIPYVSRLFRNVTTGRTASSLMLMVTPRIIIQEEEELAQTGFDPTRQ